MKKTLSLLLIGLFLSLAMANVVSVTSTEETTARQESVIDDSPGPICNLVKPGFVIGWYDTVDWVIDPWTDEPLYPRALYSKHMLFGWHIFRPELYFPIWINIGFFATMVKFWAFPSTFHGFFSGTEPGFICGIAEIQCFFTYPPYP